MDFVFEAKYIDSPICVVDIVEESDPDSVQDTINQDNIELPLQEIVPEEQILHHQEVMSLRRSTREKRNAIPYDYIVFLQEHEVNGIVGAFYLELHQMDTKTTFLNGNID